MFKNFIIEAWPKCTDAALCCQKSHWSSKLNTSLEWKHMLGWFELLTSCITSVHLLAESANKKNRPKCKQEDEKERNTDKNKFQVIEYI